MKKLKYLIVLLSFIACSENSIENNTENDIVILPDTLSGEVIVQSYFDNYEITAKDVAEISFYLINKTNKDIYLTRSKKYSTQYSRTVQVNINGHWIVDSKIVKTDTTIILKPDELIEEKYNAYFDGQWKVSYPIEYENGIKDTVESNLINVTNSYEQFVDYEISQDQTTGELILYLENNLSEPITIHYVSYPGCYENLCSYTYASSSGFKWIYWDFENSKWSYNWIGTTVDCYSEGPFHLLAPNEEFTTKLKEDFPEEGIIISKIRFFFGDNEAEYKYLTKELYYKRIE